jgi:phosphoribosylglycinamide formyltransferase 1
MRSDPHRRLGVLISGRGSNLQALIDAVAEGRLDADIALVASNRPDAQGLTRARTAGIPTVVLDHRGFGTRDLFEQALVRELRDRGVSLVCLAGFMRLLGATFLEAFPNRILNIHPSLLPAFPGLDTHRRALAAGVKVHGCTVHFVTAELDHGPIVVQAAVPVLADDDAASLAARVLEQEHVVYPRAVRWFLDDRLQLGNGVVHVKGNDAQLVLARR